MSDRTCVIDMPISQKGYASAGQIHLFMDGDSGTWRLFIGNADDPFCGESFDFTLSELRILSERLTQVLVDIARDPDSFNAEVRRAWESCDNL